MSQPTLHILSGGAAQALVARLQPAFEAAHGCRLETSFGAVGVMKDRLLGGAPCDVVILTAALIAELAGQGHAVAGTDRALGVVMTGVALKAGAGDADVSTLPALDALLQRAPGIYFPDPAKATAGIHFMKVLERLGLATSQASRLRTYPNGAAAMAALAQAPEQDAVGCTQVTEILYTPGVRLTGLLPAPYELATTYTAGVSGRSTQAALAAQLISALSGPEAQTARRDCGFVPEAA